MHKRLIGIIGLLLVLGGIGYVLAANRARMAARSESFELTAYPVAVVPVVRRDLAVPLTQIGEIAARKDVAVISETQGKVTAVYVDIGSKVAAGSLLAKVDDELPRANFLTAQTSYEKARKDLERLESLYRQEIIALSELEAGRLGLRSAEAQYTSARRQYRNAGITSPIAGQISAKAIEVGTMVAAGMAVANVVDISQLKVKLNLAEADVFQVKPGDPVTIRTDVYPERVYSGQVATVSAKGDEAHTYPVEIRFQNDPQYPLKAGMFARVTFRTQAARDSLVIPREALAGSVKDPQVYVVAGRVARLRRIVIGKEAGSYLAVLQGLREGERVVVNGQNNLTDNVRVTLVQSR
jgi:RND family efflux transporter MFP subunit